MGERSEEGAQSPTAGSIDPAAGSSPPGRSSLTPADLEFTERWAQSFERTAADPRYTFGSEFVTKDFQYRAELLRKLLDAATHAA